ncbi:hypothetical protein J3Q64DRAFT_1148239 [Phycomyces blakesleeanus]|uniref:REM-1 domain-containing protein n=1 Tax=Phycomyces blakesleeanus TaxID=4837 RepID=A0ABR3AUI3_PHYBL
MYPSIVTTTPSTTNKTTAGGRSPYQLEIDHAYLAEQNAHLHKELAFSRYTINALKNINVQKDDALLETRQELDRAYMHIKLLGMTIMRYQQQQQQQQQQQGQGLLTDPSGTEQLLNQETARPLLISDADSSDDQELSDEEECSNNTSGPTDIMSKLPLRRPVSVYEL